MYRKQSSVLDQFTSWAGNPQPSAALPVTGVGAGLLRHFISRKDIPEAERKKELIRSVLLGGLSGTGLELARLGTANMANTYNENNVIPRDVKAYYVPDSDLGPVRTLWNGYGLL